MDWRAFLKAGFEYDRWANRAWLSSLNGFKNLDRPFQVLDHILKAQMIWLERCGMDHQQIREDQPLENLFGQLAEAWIQLLDAADLDEVIDYTNLRGEPYSEPLAQIAMHVINHGTYHRGHLRGLAEADGFTNFPETDLILYLRQNPL
ncbi:MAG TPA: DinB family protein [Fimbriimonadaceae bacterium]|jgi:uncharacterized damage-inducible protein DinB